MLIISINEGTELNQILKTYYITKMALKVPNNLYPERIIKNE